MGDCTRLTYTANGLWSEQPGPEDYGQQIPLADGFMNF